jgi:uncharacterized UBP type Zn finger protein
VAKLVEMGFPPDRALQALQANNQDEEAALNSLLSGADNAPTPAPAPVQAGGKKASGGMFGMWGKK